MKKVLLLGQLLVLAVFLVACSHPKRVASAPAKTIVVKNSTPSFDLKIAKGLDKYLPYGSETALTFGDFGIYYDQAFGDQSFVAERKEDSLLVLNYFLRSNSKDNESWLSLRKEFKDGVYDLSWGYGIRLLVKEVDVFSEGAALKKRLTICDVKDTADWGLHGQDRMWWCDQPSRVASGDQWDTLEYLFSDFHRPPNTDGVRNGLFTKINWDKVAAFEINFLYKGNFPGTLTIRKMEVMFSSLPFSVFHTPDKELQTHVKMMKTRRFLWFHY